MASYTIGSTATLTVQWYEFSGGPPTNVSGQTIQIVRLSDATVILGPTGVGITNIATGLYTFVWTVPSGTQLGDYAVIWNAIDAQLEPVQTSEVISILAVGTGPCDWSITVDTTCCPEWLTITQAQRDKAITYATKIMWTATGRRYGTCVNVVRPCGNDRRCGDCGSITTAWGGWVRPYILDGLWRNCGCPCACTCRPHCEVKLPGPVAEVTQVLVDGIVLDPSLWRVDDLQWLVRTDGECWPKCQDYNVDVPAVGTFEVTYLRGTPPPQDVLDAAGIIACEYAKHCAGSKCRLPGRLTEITRQGVSASFTDIDTLLRRGLTGIPEVDQVIVADNPYMLKARPFFYSHDTSPRTRTVTSP